MPSATTATTRRPSESVPGAKLRPAERMPTKADAQRRTVTPAAARAGTSARLALSTVVAAALTSLCNGAAGGSVLCALGALDERRKELVERLPEPLHRMAGSRQHGAFRAEARLEHVADRA